MADDLSPSPEDDPATKALTAALPEMRAVKRKGLLFSTGVAVASVALMVFAMQADKTKDKLNFLIFAAIAGFFGIAAIARWVRTSHERAVMPTLAQAFGLVYEKSPKNFYETLPQNFIPQGSRRAVDDMMRGELAGRSFRFAECKTETGGKNSSTLFQGVVLEVRAGKDVPGFLIASEKETKGFLFFKGRVHVAGMYLIHQATGANGETYGLWAHGESPSREAGLRIFMDRVIALGPRVLGSATLYSLVSNGTHYYVSLRHKQNMFRIGGMFSPEDEVMTHMRAAAAQLGQPIDLVGKLLQAEAEMLAAERAPPA